MTATLVLLASLASATARAEDGPLDISELDTVTGGQRDTYWSYPLVSIPLKPGASLQHYVIRLRPALRTDFLTKDFEPVQVPAGTSLEINSLNLGYSIGVATAGSLRRAKDFPQLGEITTALDSTDPKEFLAMILKLAEERIPVRTEKERDEAIALHGEKRAWHNPSILASAFVEVKGVVAPKPLPQARYFVPMQEIANGAAKIDLASMKLQVLKGLSVFVVREMAKGPQFARFKQAFSDMALSVAGICNQADCPLSGTPSLGLLTRDLFAILLTGSKAEYSKQDRAGLSFRKQVCAFYHIHKACPGLKGFEDIEDMARLNGLGDCTEQSKLTEGLTDLSEPAQAQ